MKPMLLAGGFVFLSLTTLASRHPVPAPAAASAAFATADGETLFRGVFFRKGPAADLASSLGSAGQQPIDPSIAAIEERVIARLRSTDPAFFTSFATELKSGSFVRVETALNDAGAR